jgi:hypothetical protein
MDKCCTNCAFFEQKKIPACYNINGKLFNGSVNETNCLLHKGVKITYPDGEFCGDEYFRPISIKTRLENLEKLDINE